MQMRHRNMLAEAHFLRTKTEPRLVSEVTLCPWNRFSLRQHKFYKPWEIRSDEEEQIKRQIEDAEKAIQVEADKHREEKKDEGKGDNSEEMYQEPSSTAHVSGGEALEEPDNQHDIVQDNSHPSADLVGADTTNDKQAAMDKVISEVDTISDENNSEAQAAIRKEETRKQEEKTNEDHGGEELVEGQEDDVIY